MHTTFFCAQARQTADQDGSAERERYAYPTWSIINKVRHHVEDIHVALNDSLIWILIVILSGLLC